MTMAEWHLTLELTDKRGTTYAVALPLSDDAIKSGMSWRLAEEIEVGAAAGLGVIGMADMGKMIERREFRRDLLDAAAKQLAGILANHMQDAEGWHGRERADRMHGRGRSHGG